MFERIRRQGVGARLAADETRLQADARSELAAVTAQLAAAQATIRGLGADLNVQRTLVANSEARTRTLAASVERYARALTAERAEVARLNGELADATAPGQPAPDFGAERAYLVQQVELHKANAARLDNRLAAAEGRHVIGSLT